MTKPAGVIICFLAVLFFSSNMYASGQIIPKIGIQFPGELSIAVNGVSVKCDIDSGLIYGVEYLSGVDDQVLLGAGCEYVGNRKISKVLGISLPNDSRFSFLPIYGLIKYPLKKEYPAYLKAHLGYNVLFSGNENYGNGWKFQGDIYWAIGGGITIKKTTTLEVLYSTYKGNMSKQGFSSTEDIFTNVGVSFKYIFNL